ncbi:hypothetical protein ACS0TY_015407 [Phlomoides rotata]
MAVYLKREKHWPRVFYDRSSTSLVRTFLYDGGPLPFEFRLLRVLACVEFVSLEDIFRHVNSQYLIWSSRHNVHTLIFKDIFELMYAPSEIWYMRQLRYAKFYRVVLPDPPPSDQVGHLPNLQRL